ncbi:MAG TPA: monovalent cation/H(+) antiporter subunit G, partial [Candidatus Agrococcus pullicola]|nr:monovalent cation/H(+) antiporter subunit G [Candidatus Agrococcus pullicola]
MSTEDWLNLVGGACIALGSLLGLVAAVGLVRLPDSLNRMHAASK